MLIDKMKSDLKKMIFQASCPFIIAEISANHGGNIDIAKKTILEAKKVGADAVKIQTYNPDSMTINSFKEDFMIKHGLWKGKNLYELYKEAQTPFSWQKELFDFARREKIVIFSTPFDQRGVDMLEDLDTPFYKVASFEITDLPLIKYIALKKKPIFISTGISNQQEILEALNTIREFSTQDIVLLHCTSAYPAKIEEYNLSMIETLKKFNTLVGLSDHTLGIDASLAAVALGACVIEKHFTIDKNIKSPDSKFSITPKQMKSLVIRTKKIWKGLGKGDFSRSNNEIKNRVFRRSIYFVKNLKKGDSITKGDVKIVRPGYGLSPKYINELIGRKITKSVEVGDRVTWKVLK